MMLHNEERRPLGKADGAEENFTLAPSLLGVRGHLRVSSRPTLRLEALAAQLGPFGRRVVEEALTTAMPAFWERRAEQLDEARPRPTDFNGRASSAELAERDRRLAELAAACREHAEVLRMFPEEEAVVDLVAEVWNEVRAA